MGKAIKVTCDECERDITTTANSIGYRIALVSEMLPSRGGVVTDMRIPCPINPDRYFCRVKCLKEWIAKNL